MDLGKTTISRNRNAETMESVTFEQWFIWGLDKNVNLDLQKQYFGQFGGALKLRLEEVMYI